MNFRVLDIKTFPDSPTCIVKYKSLYYLTPLSGYSFNFSACIETNCEIKMTVDKRLARVSNSIDL